MWQEYARHVYARLGTRTGSALRFEPARDANDTDRPALDGSDPWDHSMACIDATVGELERDGWLVNQTRMWLASQCPARHGADWRDGEDRFLTHLLDGSRAANRLGWQWTIGAGTGKSHGFSRWQVEKRAPELCPGCARRDDCPIEEWPDERTLAEVDGDPALAARPELPVVFAFDEPLLTRLRLSSKRLAFLTERLAELAESRTVEVRLGDPATVLPGRALATTFTPVPKARRPRSQLDVVDLHPWPWLVRLSAGPISSFSVWRRSR